MSKFKNREIPEEILNNFTYDEDSPACLIWKIGDRNDSIGKLPCLLWVWF